MAITPIKEIVSAVHFSTVDWGNMTELFGGVATLLAVTVALIFSTKDIHRKNKLLVEQQATKISAWPARNLVGARKVIILNSSEQPIYDVAISYGVAYGAGMSFLRGNEDNRCVLRVPPGQYYIPEPRNPGGGMHIQAGISISFRDAAGKYWRRAADGKLASIPNSTFSELGITEPISEWTPLSRVGDRKKFNINDPELESHLIFE